MRAAAVAAAVIVAFLGLMYVRFASDTVPPPPEPSPSPDFGPARIVARSEPSDRLVRACENFSRYPKPPQCAATGLEGIKLSESHWPTLTPDPANPPHFLNGLKLIPLEIGRGIDFPDDTALIVETGCWQCDGPTTGLVRVYRDSAGNIRIDDLISAEKLGLPTRVVQTDKGVEESAPEITAFAVDPDGSELIVALCTRGFCGGDFVPSADSETALFRSTDGGITWGELGRLGPGHYMRRGFLAEGRVLVSTYTNGVETHQILPGGDELKPPLATQAHIWPRPLANGQVLWQTGDGKLLRDDGSVYFDPGGPTSTASGDILVAPGGANRALLNLLVQEDRYLVEIASGGTILRAFLLPDFFVAGAWPEDGLLFGNTGINPSQLPAEISLPPPNFVNYLPAVIDLGTGITHPITDPFLNVSTFANGRNHIVAVQQGPFARVVNTDNTCVNIRSAPNTGAEILDCAAEGVLLRHRGETGGDGTNVFLHVLPQRASMASRTPSTSSTES